MRNNVFGELKTTIHYSNRSGARASCPDCHVPPAWTHKIAREIQASKEVWGKLFGSLSTREKFLDNRFELASQSGNGCRPMLPSNAATATPRPPMDIASKANAPPTRTSLPASAAEGHLRLRHDARDRSAARFAGAARPITRSWTGMVDRGDAGAVPAAGPGSAPK